MRRAPAGEWFDDWKAHVVRHRMGRGGHHHRARGTGAGRKGALKFLVLDLVRERPRHGYDVIKAMEEQSRGLYSPSPGSIYPVLQMLEDQGFVRGREDDGRRVYEITDEGLAHLEEHGEKVRHHWHHMPGRAWPKASREGLELLDDLRRLFGGIASSVWRSADDPAKIASIREVLQDAGRRVEDIAGPDEQEDSAEEAGAEERGV